MRKLSGRRPLPHLKGELAKGVRGMLPRKILKFDVAKRPLYALLKLRASHFSSLDIPKKRSYSDHLPVTLTEDEHFNDTG